MSEDGESTDDTVPPLIFYDSSSDESEDEQSEVGDYEDEKFWATNNDLNDTERPIERLFVNAEEMVQELNVPKVAELLRDPDIWIADTGASNHSTWSDHGAENVRETGLSAQGQWGKVQKMKEGNIEAVFCDKNGNEYFEAKLVGVGLAKEMNYNLFSLSKLMQDGWKLSGDVRAMQLTKGQATIKFDIVIPTKKGAIYCAYIKRKTNGEVQAGNLVSGSIDAARAHDLLGHSHEDSTKEMARYLG